MITRICDRCGQPIFKGQLRYTAKVQVFAAADPLEIDPEDLQRDFAEEQQRLIDQCSEQSEEQLMREVYVEFEFDLCPPCQRAYVKNPIPTIYD